MLSSAVVQLSNAQYTQVDPATIQLFATLLGSQQQGEGQGGGLGAGPITSALVGLGSQLLGINQGDTDALRRTTQQQAQTQTLANRNLQQQIRGEETAATRAIRQRVDQFARGNRQSLAQSQQAAGVSGTTTGRTQFQAQNQQFRELLVQLLGQNQQNALSLAAGQAPIVQRGQAALAETEQAQIGQFSQDLGRIFSEKDAGNLPDEISNILDKIFTQQRATVNTPQGISNEVSQTRPVFKRLP